MLTQSHVASYASTITTMSAESVTFQLNYGVEKRHSPLSRGMGVPFNENVHTCLDWHAHECSADQ